MTMKKKFALLLCLCFVLLAAGCGSGATTKSHTISNIDGTEIQVPVDPQRVAVVYGPAYEAMVVLGAEDRVVVCADVQFENFPWATKIFKRIGKLPYLVNVHSSVSTESLLQYKPDLVFTFTRPNELRQMKMAKLAAVPGVTSQSLDDVKAQLMVYAQALGGDARDAAQRYADYFDKKRAMVKAVTDTIPQEERPRVYYAGVDMLTTYGKYSDICELIEDAGGIAVSGELEAGNRTQINFEQLVAWNPDYIFIDHGGMNDKDTVEQVLDVTYQTKRCQAVNAVANRQVYLSPSGVFYWDMGLQKILLLMYVAKTIHPEEFASLDMVQEVQEFYRNFYHYDLTDEEAQRILNRQDP